MAATPFTDGVTPINTEWLNDVNTFLHTLLSNPATLYALFKQGINRAYAAYATNTDISAVIPADNTIPQITEGTQVLSVTITPRNASARIRLRVAGTGTSDQTPGAIIIALFKTGTANALKAHALSVPTAGHVLPFALEHEDAPASTAALTYTVRVGPTAGNARLNGNFSGTLLGGVETTTLVAEEILV